MTSLADQFLQDAGAAVNAPKMSIADQFAADAKSAPMPQVAAQTQPAGQTSTIGAIGAGLGHGVGSAVLAAQQLIGHGLQSVGAGGAGDWLVNDANQGIQRIDSEYAPYRADHPYAAPAADIAGNVAATAPLTAFAPEMAGATIGAKVASGAALGAANGALQPVQEDSPDYWAKKALQVGIGAGTGAIAAPISAGIGKAISGATGTAQRMLADKGVTMTPGQILGGGFAATEDKLTSIPLIGDLVKNAQQRSVQDFNRAAYNEALHPLGQTYSGPVGNEGVQSVKSSIGSAYAKALANMTLDASDPAFQADVAKVGQMANGLPDAQRKTFVNVLKTQIFDKLGPQGTMDGEALKGVQSELGKTAKGYLGDPSFDARQLGAALAEVRTAVDNSLARTNQPEAVQGLENANAAYAKYARIRAAAASQAAMNRGGIFSPSQLANAVKSLDKSVGKGATATGNALMQDFAVPAQEVLGSKYPDSGTPGRAFLGTLAGAAAGAVGGHYLPMEMMAPAAVGGAALSLPYTSMGQKLAQALLMKRPAGADAIGKAIESYIAPVSPLLVPSTLNSAQR